MQRCLLILKISNNFDIFENKVLYSLNYALNTRSVGLSTSSSFFFIVLFVDLVLHTILHYFRSHQFYFCVTICDLWCLFLFVFNYCQLPTLAQLCNFNDPLFKIPKFESLYRLELQLMTFSILGKTADDTARLDFLILRYFCNSSSKNSRIFHGSEWFFPLF